MEENKEYIELLRRKYSSDIIDSYDYTEILEFVMYYAQPRSDAQAMAEELEKSFNSFSSICETPIDILEEKGLIRDAKLFYFQEMFSEYKGELKPGVYELSTGMTPYEMMEIMSASDEEEE